MMLGVLLRQELRRLWPWIALLAALDVSLRLQDFLQSVPDRATWVSTTPLFQSSARYAGLRTLLFALLFCQAGFPRDSEDGTLAFLFSLPVSRAQIFLARALTPALILSGEALLSELLRFAAHLPSAGSFDGHTFRMDWQLQTLALSVALAWIGVGYGQLLTAFGRFGFLFGIALYMILPGLERYPLARKLNPTSVLHVEFVGQRALLSWSALTTHALCALLATSVAAWFWLGATERASASAWRWKGRPLLAWGAGVLLACLGTWWLVGAGRERRATPSTAEVASPAFDNTRTERSTRHHDFIYPKGIAPRIEQLAAAADEIRERLAERLGVDPAADRVTVDFTRASPTHGGSATWNTIRMDASKSPTDEALERVFAHESTHVLSLRATERRLSSEADAVGLFAEGLAEALALELRPSVAVEEALRLEALIAQRRLQLTFSQLVRYSAFTQHHGPLLVYPVGLLWTQAMLASCGAETLKKLLKELGSPHAPLQLAPEGLWQHLLQRADCDIARVNAGWERQLATGERELALELASIPDLLGGNAHWDGNDVRLLARVEGEPAEGTQFFVNVRAKSTAPETGGIACFFAPRRADGTIEFRVPGSWVLDGSLQFQLGLRFERTGLPVRFAHEWTKARVAP